MSGVVWALSLTSARVKTTMSFLTSWIPRLPTALTDPSLNKPASEDSSPSTEEVDDGSDTEKETDDNPPAFPSLNSAQRIQVQAPEIHKILTDTQLMPPPPAPHLISRTIGVSPSGRGGLAVPPTTTKIPTKPSKKREKVALAPGHSPLDWAALKSSGQDLRVSHIRLSFISSPSDLLLCRVV